jgi:hypothetical protein
MDAGRLAQVLGAQMSDAEKRARADCVIETGRGRRITWAAVSALVRACGHRGRKG